MKAFEVTFFVETDDNKDSLELSDTITKHIAPLEKIGIVPTWCFIEPIGEEE